MDFLNVVILGVVSFIVLFVLSRIMGYRAISELSFFDYVVGITIGSVAAEMSTNIDMEWWKGVTAMVIYALLDVLFTVLSQKNVLARQIISGNPIILIYKGKIYKKNLKKARIELNDLLSSARSAGYFNIADVDYAIMETTGKISFQPVALKRPLNPKDFNFAPQSEGLTINVIMDGKIMEDDLADAKIDKKDLIRRVRQQDKDVKNIFLGIMDSNGVLTLFDK
ncbi:MAG: DUF421 domain-containing protein [Eubacterium sp.]|jgi:uncharacterized membrane protein YcaP (DUF421 family)|uniref:YetF domain-containing protein n=1 Tax=Duncaniella muris TaxID=2094150 RepID=UPI00216D0B08|nr:DUF421 domain-containing protein [Duncaniella muris]MCI9111973.1 DUF421 domain-containing protein [Eubacterium sp.]